MYMSPIIIMYNYIGEIKKRGVVTPITEDIYKPILRALKNEGIEASTSVVNL